MQIYLTKAKERECYFIPEGASPLYAGVTPRSISKLQGFGVISAERWFGGDSCTEGSRTAKSGTDEQKRDTRHNYQETVEASQSNEGLNVRFVHNSIRKLLGLTQSSLILNKDRRLFGAKSEKLIPGEPLYTRPVRTVV